jgi:hypothetical protein
MTTSTKVQNKVADLRYITTLKNKPYIRIYIYRSSDDSKDYEVTTVHGKVSSCTTPATHPCYICKDAQAREDASKPSLKSLSDDTSMLNGACEGFSLLKR